VSAPQPTDPGGPPPLDLRHHRSRNFALECGVVLDEVDQAYTLQGEINAQGDNVVLLFHSLTGSADPTNTWGPLIGPGRPIDTRHLAVLAPNLLGSCYGTTRPPVGATVTPRDMVRLVERLVTDLGVRSIALATGGSLGGMVTLEWVAEYGSRTRAAAVFAAPAAHTAQAIAFNHVQRHALELGQASGQPEDAAAGLALARMAAMLTYRTADEFGARFGRNEQEPGSGWFAMQSYLDHQGRKFVERFDPAAYRTLIDAMDAHDLGRGRGGVGPALANFGGRLIGIGIPGDLLYLPSDVRAWVDAAPRAEYLEICSRHGHDAFLLETEQVGAVIRDVFRGPASDAETGGPPAPSRSLRRPDPIRAAAIAS
jgi:homoserine O-acetyltransferase